VMPLLIRSLLMMKSCMEELWLLSCSYFAGIVIGKCLKAHLKERR
jgi:hypothetical protein